MKTRNFPVFVIGLLFTAAAVGDDWAQWGGPRRDFKPPASALVEKWPAAGPRAVWKRELGEGYSAVLAAGDTLYTMYRAGETENVVALSAATGETRWTHTYDAPLLPKTETGFGKGPNATPLLMDGRLITVGFTGKLFCLDAKTGKPLWSSDLMKDQDATFLQFGYSSSPLPHRDTVILPVGAKGRALAAFNLADGKIRWSAGNFENSYSTPILVEVGSKKHVTLVTTTEIVGFDADTGAALWSHPYKNQWDTHCTTPVDCGQGRVFYPSFEGGVLLQLKSGSDGTEVKQLWTTKRIGSGQTNVVCIGEHLYGAGGSGRAGFFVAARLSDGAPAWRERVPLANAVYADNRLIVLDENGVLRLVKASPDKYESICQAELLQSRAWTAPTLADGRLYLRDQKHILAIDLRTQ